MSDRKIIQMLDLRREIVSEHRHDFRRCSCSNIAVDGGQDYIRRLGDIRCWDRTWVDTSIYDDDE